MTDAGKRHWGWFRAATLVLLAATAVCLLGAWGLAADAKSVPSAQVTDADDVQVLAATLGRDTYGLFLVDHSRETICVYQYVPRERKLKLTAVRRYTFDARVDEPGLRTLQNENDR
ncbi:MAG: hypothetical protein JXA11_08445 [Phycisphaerae bacterium]|nr:hypothetical protein [Phycisphaerae bacterium]